MAEFDKREWIYNRVDISGKIREVRFVNGNVYAYVGKDEFIVDPASVSSSKIGAVRETYRDILHDSFSQTVPSYERAYSLTTKAPPEKLIVNDQSQ